MMNPVSKKQEENVSKPDEKLEEIKSLAGKVDDDLAAETVSLIDVQLDSLRNERDTRRAEKNK